MLHGAADGPWGGVLQMTCAFLDDFTLAKLIAPVTEEEFRARHFERRPLLVQRQDPNYYGNLLTLQDFDDGIASAPGSVKTAEAKSKKATKYEGGGASSLPFERILGEMRDGATLVLDAFNTRESKLNLLCRLLEQQTGHRYQTNIYLTPPNGAGFTPHWDNHDVFILQVLGTKHWRMEKERRTFPNRDEHMGEEGRELAPDADAFTLRQGDVVYIPRGFVHAAECGSEPSMHITLGIHAYFWQDLLEATVKALAKDDQRLLQALPLGFMHGRQDVLVKGAIAALRKAGDESFIGAVVEKFRDELVTKFPLDVSGQVFSFFQASELKGDDVVGPRAGIVYRVHPGEETVRLNFGGRTITFPDFFGEPLKFALNNKAYKINDIAGDLEPEEKLVFVERLLQEGIVVRK
jgi:ribosomal protein L16 Arg81 hydroxylase